VRFIAAWLFATLAFVAAAQSPRTSVVVMHGKGGLPDGLVHELAMFLDARGFLVANLEMPWSSRRDYDVDVAAGLAQVEAALADLRTKGAAKVFVAGHSQGGVFALYVAGKIPVDGVVAIAPGGNVATPAFRQYTGESVDRAADMVKAGKGAERARFVDYEGRRGTSPVFTTAASYLSWFDPDGAMNELASIHRLDAKMPVLFIAPTDDYPMLLRTNPEMIRALPKNPLTKVYKPDASHVKAPTASREEIARWIAEVASR
jgi:pimeloyl-ACP methyl ester carboxylesterase